MTYIIRYKLVVYFLYVLLMSIVGDFFWELIFLMCKNDYLCGNITNTTIISYLNNLIRNVKKAK